jgi:hypothetical protein
MTTTPSTAVEIPKLSPAQEKMLLAANKRYGKLTPGGEEAHFTYVGGGQAGTAKALERLGLGGYTHDAGRGGAKLWIWEKGHEVAEAIVAKGGEGR